MNSQNESLEEEVVSRVVNHERGPLEKRPVLQLLASAEDEHSFFTGLATYEQRLRSTLVLTSALSSILWDLRSRGPQWNAVQEFARKAVGEISARLFSGGQGSGQPTVPLIVDAVRELDLARLNYFYIESGSALARWHLSLGGSEFPFLLINLAGIILQPFGAATFENAGLIDEMFETLEGKLGFVVSVGDLWMPAAVFKKDEASTGNVFRANLSLFRRAYEIRDRFATASISADSQWKTISMQLEEFPAPEFSKIETQAFAEWSEKQIKEADEGYPKDEQLALGGRQK